MWNRVVMFWGISCSQSCNSVKLVLRSCGYIVRTWLSVANAIRLLNKRLYSSVVGMRTDDKQKSHNVTLSIKHQKLEYIAISNRKNAS